MPQEEDSPGGPRTGARPTRSVTKTPTTCSAPDCPDRARSRGLCPKHYSRWLRHGSTDRKQRSHHGTVARLAVADAAIALAAGKLLNATPEQVCDLLGLTAADLRAALDRFTHARQIGQRDRIGPNRDAPAGQKWCPRCKLFLLLDRFNRSGVSGDGRQNYCAECSRANARERRARMSS